ncbi:lysozyme [Flavobacterium sp.]|uniref:lysozyme n=1 Tax=Flavobacterium sp. TaxID=239 RepID=UPI00286BD98C|nr:lysozyme [Flavobacterium sp.]
MITGKKGILIIEEFEGFEPKMYKDAVGLPTIGYGTLIDTKEEQWLKTAIITKDQAEVLLRRELGMIERNLNVMLKKTITQNQFDALVSFAYNLGIANLRSSTLLKKVNRNPADTTIRDEFMKWVHAGGKVLKGLQTRRKAEADLYFKK